jgi:hypothetical protein
VKSTTDFLINKIVYHVGLWSGGQPEEPLLQILASPDNVETRPLHVALFKVVTLERKNLKILKQILYNEHRDRTRMQMPPKIFPHLKGKC